MSDVLDGQRVLDPDEETDLEEDRWNPQVQRAREEIDLNEEPLYDLDDDLLDFRSHKSPVHLCVVKNRQRWGRAGINMGKKYLTEFRGGVGLAIAEKELDYYRRQTAAEFPHVPGRVEEKGDDLVIHCGIRRPPKLPDQTIARGIFLNGLLSPAWAGRQPTQSFYGHLVHPYICRSKTKNPFEWAHERAQIAAGFARVMDLDHDYPLDAAIDPYIKMAHVACNTLPESLNEPRRIQMDDRKRALKKSAEHSLGASLAPETLLFLLERAYILPENIFHDEEARALLLKLPECFENGLSILRFGALFDAAIKKPLFSRKQKSSPEEALKFSLRLVTAIYGGAERPWWFQEDFDFTDFVDLKSENPEFYEAVACASGPAFTYGLQVFQKEGRMLAQEFPEITEDEAVFFSADITRWYGIGNIQRACNVIAMAREVLKIAASEDRREMFEKIRRHAESQKPENEIIGRLEGEEANMHLPGVIALMAKHGGKNLASDDKADDFTVKPAYLALLQEPLGRPLLERATVAPSLRISYEPRFLLAANVTPRLMLPASASHTETALAVPPHPAIGIFRIYDQIRQECGGLNSNIAEDYFAFYAAKFPDPFAPPAGFFRFLMDFKDVPMPDYIPFFMVSPDERSEVRERNKSIILNRYLVISNLLDAWVLGFLPWETLEEIFAFITEDPPARLLEEEEQKIRSEQPDGYRDGGVDEIKDTARSNVQSIWRNTQLQRWPAVQSIISFFEFLNMLGVLHAAEPGQLKDPLAQQIHSILENERQLPPVEEMPVNKHFHFSDAESYRKANDALFEMINGGIFDKENFARVFSEDFSGLNKIIETAQAMVRCVEVFQNVKDGLRKAELNLAARLHGRPLSGEVFLDELERVRKNLQDEAFIKAAENPYIRKDRLAAFIKDHLALYFQACALGGIVNFQMERRPAQESQTSRSVEYSVRHISHSVGSMAASLHALRQDPVAFAAFNPSGYLGTAEVPNESSSTALSMISMGAELRLRNQTAADQSGTMKAQMGAAYSQAREAMRNLRQEGIGLLPVGAKVHILHDVDEFRFEIFAKMFGLERSQFWMEGSKKTLILPAAPTAQELALIFQAMRVYRILDPELPELQLTLPGRLQNTDCAVLGTTLLLATTANPTYNEKSFVTSHDQITGRCIFIHDAGGALTPFPFMAGLNKDAGRTDVLGRLDPADAAIYQTVGTTLVHGKYGGPFGKFAEEFKAKNAEILRKYGLEELLEAPWIKDDTTRRHSSDLGAEHFKALTACTQAFQECAARFHETGKQEGIIFEMRDLVVWLGEKIKEEQEKLRRDPKACAELALLLE